MKRVNFYKAGVLTFVAVSLLACGSREHEKSGRNWQQKVSGVKTELITRYDPIEFPPKDFTERKVFTWNLQELLTQQGGKPVLFDGFLDDITKDRKQFAVHFTSNANTAMSDHLLRNCPNIGDCQSIFS